MISIDLLKKIVGDNLVFEMQGTLEMFEINTPLRASHFLSQCSHESENYSVLSENLNYSATGLMAVFKKYFPDINTANAYAKQPQKIANKVYANRIGNGDEASGDGWFFHGRGFIQTTGRANYQALADAIQEPLIMTTPDLLLMKKYACLSAGYFWKANNINSIADLGSEDEVVRKVTLKVNGGLNGITDRQKKFQEIFKILNG